MMTNSRETDPQDELQENQQTENAESESFTEEETSALEENEEEELLDQLMRTAWEKGATDIHLDPVPDGLLIRFRVDGGIRPFETLAWDEAKKLLIQIRVRTELDFGRVFTPMEGQFTWTSEDAAKDIRVTLIPIGTTESVHLRILTPPEALTDITQLGFGDRDLEIVRRNLSRPQGLVIVAGPTGAGKSTSLYSLASTFDLAGIIAVSIEDPVEFAIPHIRQLEVDDRHDLTMYEGLRVLLRMDPDLLMVAEIRDSKSAVTSARAAAAARFVLATLHSRDAAAAVEAFHYLSVPYSILGGSLRVIIAQNLIRKLCTECRRSRNLDEEEKKLFEFIQMTPPETVYEAGGCEVCDQYGYRGRTGIFEVVEIDEDLGREIAEGRSQLELRRLFRERGFQTMIEDGLAKVANGITSLEEILNLYWPGAQDGIEFDLGSWKEEYLG